MFELRGSLPKDAPDKQSAVFVQMENERGSSASPFWTHQEGLLLLTLTGLLVASSDNGLQVAPAGFAVWFPPFYTRDLRRRGLYRGLSISVNEAACRGLPTRACAVQIKGLLKKTALTAADRTRAISEQPSPCIEALQEEICRDTVEGLSLLFPQDPRLKRVAQSLIANPADNRLLEDWASLGATSKRTLSRRFVTETGLTFTAWRQRLRLLQSMEMLVEHVPMKTISLALGFCSASNYISIFRQVFSETPAQYLRRTDKL